MLRARVREEIARSTGPVVGVAFDGDADRALFVDEAGDVLTGDHVMLIVARDLDARGELPGDTVVGTVMSNMGFEKALERAGIRLVRAAVGDRYVLEMMRNGGYRFGGEQSGHVIDLSRGTTGDGPMTAVALFSIAMRTKRTLHELAADLAVYPQVLLNVRVTDKTIAEHPNVRDAIAAAERELAGDGRILVRPSGTEPLVRVMVESSDRDRTDALAKIRCRHDSAVRLSGGVESHIAVKKRRPFRPRLTSQTGSADLYEVGAVPGGDARRERLSPIPWPQEIGVAGPVGV